MALNKMSEVFGGFRHLHRHARCNIFYLKKDNFSSTHVVGQDMMSQKPIKYSETEASKLTASDIFTPKPNPAVLPVERFIILGSLCAFLIYFCILRKENKIDEILGGTYRYEGDEELKLLNALLHAKIKGLKTDDLENKLREIRAKQ